MGKTKAIKTFREALALPAYQKFLKQNSFDPSSVKTFDDFTKIPITDKSNFVSKYPLEERIKFPLPQNYTIERSSGYSGSPNYWVRYSGQDDSTGTRIVTLLDMLFNLKTNRTLMLNTFALGTWIAGTKVARWMLNAANDKDLHMTVINVGINLEEAAEITKRFYKSYDQIIFLGYNPFLKELIENLSDDKFPFNKVKTHLLMGGEGFSEEWRDYMAGLMHFDIDDYDSKIISGYGAADTGSDIGVEQPIAIFFRRLLNSNLNLRKNILGEKFDKPLPMIFQYSPSSMLIEVEKEELIFTANSGMPLVRYNLHDSGGLIQYNEMVDIISQEVKGDVKSILKKLKAMPLPLVYLYGRSDGTLQLVGLNIYLEQLKTIFSKSAMQKFFTGRFFAEVLSNKTFDQQLTVTLETRDINAAQESKSNIKKLFMKELCKLNSEYNKVFNTNPSMVEPELLFLDKAAFSEHADKSIKVKYSK